jgi:hypothetical protein
MSDALPVADRQIEAMGGRRMSAVRVVALAFGIGAGLLGLLHGYFESLQGSVAPTGLMTSAIGPPCQPATAWHACEPALTVIPNFLVTGLLAMVAAVVVLVWAAAFVQRKHGGAVLLLLIAALFLVGGGFVTLIFGVIAVVAATRIDAPLTWWRAHLPPTGARILAALWPWILIAYLAWDVASWVIGSFANDFMLRITPAVTAMTPLVLVLILVVSFAYDIRPKTGEPDGG